MIKREYKHFFTRKYLLFLLPVIVFVFISGYASLTADAEGSVYSDFSNYVEFYENREELQEQYDYYKSMYDMGGIQNDDMNIGVNKEETAKRLSILKFCLDNNLEYDGIIDIDHVVAYRKYTEYNYLYNFSTAYVLFAIVACILIGGCYQSADMVTKTSKLVYTTGEKRNKIIDRKFWVSLSGLLAVTVIYYILIALFSLQFSEFTPKYLLYFVNGKLQVMNYFGYFTAMLFSQLLMVVCTYTFMYYFSVAVKNIIASICTFFVIFVISLFTNAVINSPDAVNFIGFLRMGYMSFVNVSNTTFEIKYCLYFIPIIAGIAIMVTISKIISSKADYSR